MGLNAPEAGSCVDFLGRIGHACLRRGEHEGDGMARGDFRYTPRYQFWATIVVAILWGVFIGWMIYAHGVLGGVAHIAFWMAVGIAMSWLSRRLYGNQLRSDIQSYEHSVVGLYSGIAAAVTLVFRGQTPTFALVAGILVSAITVMAVLLAIRWYDARHPRFPGWRPSTITGWR